MKKNEIVNLIVQASCQETLQRETYARDRVNRNISDGWSSNEMRIDEGQLIEIAQKEGIESAALIGCVSLFHSENIAIDHEILCELVGKVRKCCLRIWRQNIEHSPKLNLPYICSQEDVPLTKNFKLRRKYIDWNDLDTIQELSSISRTVKHDLASADRLEKIGHFDEAEVLLNKRLDFLLDEPRAGAWRMLIRGKIAYLEGYRGDAECYGLSALLLGSNFSIDHLVGTSSCECALWDLFQLCRRCEGNTAITMAYYLLYQEVHTVPGEWFFTFLSGKSVQDTHNISGIASLCCVLISIYAQMGMTDFAIALHHFAKKALPKGGKEDTLAFVYVRLNKVVENYDNIKFDYSSILANLDAFYEENKLF